MKSYPPVVRENASSLRFSFIGTKRIASILRKAVGLLPVVFLAGVFWDASAQQVRNESAFSSAKSQTALSEVQDGQQNQQLHPHFTENKGQVHDQDWKVRPDVLFSGEMDGMVFHLRENGISYQLMKVESWKKEGDTRSEHLPEELINDMLDSITIYRTDVNWIGTNPNYRTRKEYPGQGYNNYYNVAEGAEPSLEVRSYGDVWYEEIYEGIDLHYYYRNGRLESDFIVEPGSDYKQIRWEVKGANNLHVNEEGQLVMETPLGVIAEGNIKAYQGEKEIDGTWKVNGEEVTLVMGEYDNTQKLMIDPPVLLWGTYYGGSGDDYGQSCSADGSGNVYLAGYTVSPTNIATAGAHQTIIGSNQDAFLVKFNSSGVRQWGTYYGGSAGDQSYSCAVDGSGNIYFAGQAQSSTIATAGAHQTTIGGSWDAFLVKFNSSGVRLWGTYYGGSLIDQARSCFVDGSGVVYLAGYTQSTANIATSGAHQTTLGSSLDAFLVKFNSSGVRQWGTYFGGSGDDYGQFCSADGSGNVYLAGFTLSTNNIATVGAHQTIIGGSNDAFLVKFNSSGVRQWGTYYGGSSGEESYSCSVDGSGDIYLAGNTQSSANIATAGAHQTTKGLSRDAFLVKFNTSGLRLWGTYYGGNLSDYGPSCFVDGSGNVLLAGYTESTSNIATAGAYQTTIGGDQDAYLVKFNSSGVQQWGTYYGGTGSDQAVSCSVDGSGNIYLAGYAASTANIAIAGAHQFNNGGLKDAFLGEFSDCTTLITISLSSNSPRCAGTDLNLSATASGGGSSYNFIWSGPNGFTSTQQNPSMPNVTNTASGTYSVVVTDNGGCPVSAAISVVVNPNPTATASNNSTPCQGGPVNLTSVASGGSSPYSYSWNGPNGFTSLQQNPAISNFTAAAAGNYNITVTDNNTCIGTAMTTVSNPVIICTDGNTCTNDICTNFVCSYPLLCSDGNLCTNDVCTNGVCSYPDKCDDGNPCSTDACNSTNGNCTNTVFVCNDGNACTDDLCVNGGCQYPNSCSPSWVVTPTGENHTIILSPPISTYISGAALANGDYIGVFYLHNGIYYPAGMVKWMGVYNAFAAYGNEATLPAKNGFNSGEAFKFKVWRLSDRTEYDMEVSYLSVGSLNGLISQTGTYTTNGISGLSEISNCVKQSIPLTVGWNMISSHIIPDVPLMSSVFSGISSNIFLVKNALGFSYLPSPALNQIGSWDVLYGYKAKARNNTTLVMQCKRVDPFTPIPLAQNWNIISYLPTAPMSASVAMAPLGSNLILVKNNAGNTYIPSFNINNIGNMIATQGYQLKVSTAATFIYPAPRISGVDDYTEPLPVQHYIYSHNTGSNATLVIPQNVFDGLNKGDEIGVFNTGGMLTGSVVVEDRNFAITVWGDDASTVNIIDGMNEQEPFQFRLWDKETGIESELIINFSEGTNNYETDGIYVAGSKMVTGILITRNETLVVGYPNPTTGKFFFDFQLPNPVEVTVRVFDIGGKAVHESTQKNLPAGKQTIELDMQAFADGKYLYELKAGEQMFSGYIIVTK